MRNPISSRSRRIAGFLALCGLLSTHAMGAAYTVVDLGDTYQVNGFQSKVIDDKGEVIGNQVGTGGRAFLYTSGSWNELGQLNTSGTANNGTFARGLNSGGLIVGQSDTGVTSGALVQTDAFFQAGLSGSFGSLGFISGTDANHNAVAYGCNDLGTIVGNIVDYSTGTRDTFLYAQGAGIILRRSDGVYSFAVNRFGDVLGSLVGLSTSQAMLNGNPLPSSTAGFVAHAINNNGQILLSVDDVHPLTAGWGLIYNYGTGKVTALKNLSPQSAGYTTFLDINDAGDVVGRGEDADINPHAVLYTPAGGLTSLDALSLTSGTDAVHLIQGEGINNAGQIVCTGYTTDSTDLHAYLLTPDTTPAPALAATYDGIASVSGSDAGVVTLTISKTNVATVKLKSAGANYSFKATLTSGSFNGTVPVKGATLNVAMQADAAHQTVSGTISNPTPTAYAFTALRQMALGVFAGKYTTLLHIDGTFDPTLPQGTGYGLMTIGKTGLISIKGNLGDGSAYTVAAATHYDGSWTFYAPLYAKTAQPGLIAGNVAVNRAAADSDFSSMLQWSKPGSFATNVSLKAALFKAVKNTQLLRFTGTTTGTGSFAFSGGGQSLPADTVAVTNKNVVTLTAPGTDGLVVHLSTSTGAMTGTFLDPAAAGKKTSFNGVVQQKLNFGAGVFASGTNAGAVLLTPQ